MDIALTLDYELFGNGSGDMFEHVIYPTKKLLSTCDKMNVKLTIFFEVVEYWKLREVWDSGNKMGYKKDPALAMENQIIDAYKNGHDIQLHIHPQWLNAEYINNQWVLDNNWRMNDIPLHSSSNTLTVEQVIKKGKDTLEIMLQAVNEDYQCNIFRAGAFNILPSEEIISILEKLNFIADSSVFVGGYENSDYSYLDFRSLRPEIPYWVIKNGDVLNQSNQFQENRMIELPIFSLPYYRFMKYDFTRLKNFIVKNNGNRGSVIEKFNTRTNKKSFLKKIAYFFEKEYLTWDYCLFNTRKMTRFIHKAKNIAEKNSDKYIPFVAIGHSKGFVDDMAIDFLLDKNISDIYTVTLSELVKKIKLEENE